MFFKKKEKPLLRENMFDVCVKAVYTKEKGYIPTEFITYEDRIELNFNVTADEPRLTTCKAIASTKGDRLVPITLGDEEWLFDIKDKALRLKPVPEGEGMPLIPQVIIYPNDVMRMEKEFAEAHYSKEALDYATKDGDFYFWYYPDGSASPVVFETPRLFAIFAEEPLKEEQVESGEIVASRHMLSPTYLSLYSNLPIFTGTYLEAMGIEEKDFRNLYFANLKKE